MLRIITNRLADALRSPLRRRGRSEAQEIRAGWRPHFWALAALPPLFFFVLGAVRAGLYHTARSPNMALSQQLGLMLLVYGAWVLAPRFVWAATSAPANPVAAFSRRLAMRLAALGVLLAAGHLFLLTLLRLCLYATKAWLWQPIHILHNYGDVWLSFAGFWFIGYALLVLAVVTTRRHAPPPAAKRSRYEIRDKNETLLIPLEQIYWIKAAGNYVEFHTSQGVKMARKTLSQLESELCENGFLKAHRSALVNSTHVVALKNGGAIAAALLSNGELAPLSRRRIADFKRLVATAVKKP